MSRRRFQKFYERNKKRTIKHYQMDICRILSLLRLYCKQLCIALVQDNRWSFILTVRARSAYIDFLRLGKRLVSSDGYRQRSVAYWSHYGRNSCAYWKRKNLRSTCRTYPFQHAKFWLYHLSGPRCNKSGGKLSQTKLYMGCLKQVCLISLTWYSSKSFLFVIYS